MNKRPRTIFRSIDGIVLLDKPQGLSSNQALQRVRHIFRAEKAGHTGSLDPLATGLLPICLGEATKIAGVLLGKNKAYETVAKLGVTTDTDDADGQVLVERVVPELAPEKVRALLQGFIGKIQQRPPIYSALKQGGEPMYAKARRGEIIEMPLREVNVDSIDILDIGKDEISLRIVCGSGTYIRSIVRDLGELLGCGAHVKVLRRLWVAPFQQSEMHTLEELQAIAELGEDGLLPLVLPIEAGLSGWPEVYLDESQIRRFGQGQRLVIPDSGILGDVNVCDQSGRSLGLASLDQHGVLQAKRLFRWAALS
ncbi:MAG TPA: tRNA pseudouridine(55) synthase TruB [Arenimonas sp.]|nr:tRNA pseudouridine(55) synthase TruB [Arenimonas sp.]HPW32896.1 tRNA pseudouridine(55) synthase TruB [Arenimonas sp.]